LLVDIAGVAGARPWCGSIGHAAHGCCPGNRRCGCAFRSKVITDSGGSWSRNPVEDDHGFRGKLITETGDRDQPGEVV